MKFVAWDEAHLRGRVESGAASATVLTRTADGGFARHPLTVVRSHDSRAVEALHALRARLASEWDPPSDAVTPLSRFLCALGIAAPVGGLAGDPLSPPHSAEASHEPAPGLDLAAWVPARDGVFVRFRSVEAAYRFVAIADDLASALGATQSCDARSYETLRLTLRDLLLPTIWRTNPDAEPGVGELALHVAPPFDRGRLRAALILRVTDPELHRMQTEAGIAEEAHADHLWAPPDDPFPGERARRNFRRRVADVEIVATDEELCARLAERRVSPLALNADYLACRVAAGGAQGRPLPPEEALFVYDSERRDSPGTPTLEPARAVRREGEGLAYLLDRWVGPSRRAPVLVAAGTSAGGPYPPVPFPRWGVVNTDATGARVRLAFGEGRLASAVSSILRRCVEDAAATAAAAAKACSGNLADLVPLALVENPQDDVAERNFVVLGWKPVCPCGGTYSVHPITREVSCSVHGTVRSPKAAKWTPPPISDVKVDGSELSFRLAIDWNRQR